MQGGSDIGSEFPRGHADSSACECLPSPVIAATTWAGSLFESLFYSLFLVRGGVANDIPELNHEAIDHQIHGDSSPLAWQAWSVQGADHDCNGLRPTQAVSLGEIDLAVLGGLCEIGVLISNGWTAEVQGKQHRGCALVFLV